MRRGVICVAGAWLAVAVSTAMASDIRVMPTRITFEPTEKVSSITVRNEDTKVAAIQVEVMAWSQMGDVDKYDPTREVLANPALFELAPGAEQIVRVGLQVGETDIERSYRVFLQEVPLKDAPPSKDALLRIGIPLFVPPMKEIHQLQWTLIPKEKGKLEVTVVNAGTVHNQLRGFRILDDQGEVIAQENIFAYVLPKHSSTWTVDARMALHEKQRVHMEATTDNSVMREMVKIGTLGGRANPKPARSP